jgi:hypothetical protein
MRDLSFSKKKLAILAVFVILLVGLIIVLTRNRNQTQAFEFRGVVEKVESNTVYINGRYTINDEPIGELMTVRVTIDSDTQIEKVLWHMPTADQLRVSGGRWSSNDIRKETVTGKLEDLNAENKSGLNLTAKSDKNVFGKPKFMADKISYVEEINERPSQPFIAPQTKVEINNP